VKDSLNILTRSEIPRVEPTEYFYQASGKNLVRIFENPRNVNLWCISLNGQVLADNFDSPDDAADHAHRHDFPTQAAMDRFELIDVPWDIKLWLTKRPNFSNQQTTENPPDDMDQPTPRFGNN
jgi:hypothetical protein